MSIFEQLLRSQADQVRAAGQQRMQQQTRAAGRIVASAANAGATNPAAIAAEVNRAQQDERERVGMANQQQLIAAQQADQQRAERLLGGLLSTGGQVAGMLTTAGGAKQVASPIQALLQAGQGQTPAQPGGSAPAQPNDRQALEELLMRMGARRVA
jgi:hypothetical protein